MHLYYSCIQSLYWNKYWVKIISFQNHYYFGQKEIDADFTRNILFYYFCCYYRCFFTLKESTTEIISLKYKLNDISLQYWLTKNFWSFHLVTYTLKCEKNVYEVKLTNKNVKLLFKKTYCNIYQRIICSKIKYITLIMFVVGNIKMINVLDNFYKNILRYIFLNKFNI